MQSQGVHYSSSIYLALDYSGGSQAGMLVDQSVTFIPLIFLSDSFCKPLRRGPSVVLGDCAYDAAPRNTAQRGA